MSSSHRFPAVRCLARIAVLAVLLALLVTWSASADDLKELARRARDAVVVLEVAGGSGRPAGQGTGFFVGEGTIVTNLHVVEEAARIRARLADGSEVEVESILAADPEHDLAILSARPAAAAGVLSLSSRPVEVGEEIVVVGNPLGLSHTLSTGVVAAVRENEASSLVSGRVLQITAAISPGSSGSPVMNLDGEVVAVAVSQFRVGQNLNFAVPAEKVRALLDAAAGSGSAERTLRDWGDDRTFRRVAYARNVLISLLVFGGIYFAYRKLL